MNVLVINCGSSSLKYQLINSDSEEVLAKGLCERIGIDGRLVYQKEGLDKEITEAPMLSFRFSPKKKSRREHPAHPINLQTTTASCFWV